MGVVSPDALDAVTLDAFGTLLELRDPIGNLERLLPGFDRSSIEGAFEREAEFYAAHSLEARDAASLTKLREACAAVFNAALGSSLKPSEYTDALEFAWIDGAVDAVRKLRARGLAVAVVSNWDISLHDHAAELDAPVFTSAEAGARKPDPAVFALALQRLGVSARRALHVGDTDDDRDGARAAGMQFAPAPLASVVEAWT